MATKITLNAKIAELIVLVGKKIRFLDFLCGSSKEQKQVTA